MDELDTTSRVHGLLQQAKDLQRAYDDRKPERRRLREESRESVENLRRVAEELAEVPAQGRTSSGAS